jgi:hypothetical protein
MRLTNSSPATDRGPIRRFRIEIKRSPGITQRLIETPSRHGPQTHYGKIVVRMRVQSIRFTYSGARVPPLAADCLVRQEPEEQEDDDGKEEDDDDDNGDGYSDCLAWQCRYRWHAGAIHEVWDGA